MSGPERKHCSNSAINGSVIGAGIAASVTAPGAVYCAEKILPRQMDWFKHYFADHIVEPHIHTFRVLSKPLRRSHERYEEKIRERLMVRGESVADTIKKSRDIKNESFVIADAWVTGLLAASSALGANYGALKILNHIPGVNNKAGHLSLFDTAFSLLGMIAMPTVLAGPSENANHKISRFLQSKFGMNKQDAENISVGTVYGALPELGSLAGTVLFAHATNGKGN